jgi:ATP-dependent exoDNAse (exonuclease V) beta subunit
VNASDAFYLLPETGLALKPDRLDEQPLAYRYAKFIDQDQGEAENRRLLYVALTRAKNKLIVNAHIGQRGGNPEIRGWLADLLGAMGMDAGTTIDEPGKWKTKVLPSGESVGIWVRPEEENELVEDVPQPVAEWPSSTAIPIFAPLIQQSVSEDVPEEETDTKEQPVWRVTGADEQRFGIVLGRMVHCAIQHWRLPGDDGLERILQIIALENGLVDPAEQERAIREASTLLARLRSHSLWTEIDQAQKRQHEVPYSLICPDGRVENGYLDLLYQVGAGWRIADFKTDTIRSGDDLDRLTDRYAPQMRRYQLAVQRFLGLVEKSILVFLDDRGKVTMTEHGGNG